MAKLAKILKPFRLFHKHCQRQQKQITLREPKNWVIVLLVLLVDINILAMLNYSY